MMTPRFLLPARTLPARCPIPQNEQKCQQEIFKLLELRTPGESIVQTVLRIALTPLPWQDTPSLHAILHRMEFAAERANEASDVQVQPPATSCVCACRLWASSVGGVCVSVCLGLAGKLQFNAKCCALGVLKCI